MPWRDVAARAARAGRAFRSRTRRRNALAEPEHVERKGPQVAHRRTSDMRTAGLKWSCEPQPIKSVWKGAAPERGSGPDVDLGHSNLSPANGAGKRLISAASCSHWRNTSEVAPGT